jgi:hypothetical protein
MTRALLLLSALLLVAACVDGTTPDCTSQSSGCYPGDGSAPPPDAGNADATDASTVPDAPTD